MNDNKREKLPPIFLYIMSYPCKTSLSKSHNKLVLRMHKSYRCFVFYSLFSRYQQNTEMS